jgi:hypothetical protein
MRNSHGLGQFTDSAALLILGYWLPEFLCLWPGLPACLVHIVNIQLAAYIPPLMIVVGKVRLKLFGRGRTKD